MSEDTEMMKRIITEADKMLNGYRTVTDDDFWWIVNQVAGHADAERLLKVFAWEARVSFSTMGRWINGFACPVPHAKERALLALQRVAKAELV